MNFVLGKGMSISINRLDGVTLVGIDGTEFKFSGEGNFRKGETIVHLKYYQMHRTTYR